jgi:hypothetical protein
LFEKGIINKGTELELGGVYARLVSLIVLYIAAGDDGRCWLCLCGVRGCWL